MEFHAGRFSGECRPRAYCPWVLNRSPSVRVPRRMWTAVAALFVVGALALIVEGRLNAADRGLSTDGLTVVHYTLASKLLGRRLGEVAIVPAGDESRPLLVL